MIQRASFAGTARATGPVVVRASGLKKRYGSALAVAGVDFEIRARECIGLLGPNGAGKSTTVRMLYGASPVDEGRLEVLGMDVAQVPRAVKRRIGVVPQDDNLDPELSVLENLTVFARFFDLGTREARRRALALLRDFELDARADAKVEQLSGGMRRRLLIARALLNEPELLILDEPTTGLDPQARRDLWERLRRLKAQGVTQVLTTHYMDEAEKLCDWLVLMDHGRVIAEGAPRDLIRVHVAPEVLELQVDPEERDALLRALALDPVLGEAAREPLDGGVVLHVENARALEPRLDRLPVRIEGAVGRRATLEDVFLKLTGRRLRDGNGVDPGAASANGRVNGNGHANGAGAKP